MSRKPSMSAVAQVRRQRRELRQLMRAVSEFARQKRAELIAEGLLDPLPTQPVLEGHITGDQIVVDDPPAPSRRTRRK